MVAIAGWYSTRTEATVAAKPDITFPADSGVVDVTKPPYNATPNDTTDDTAAIQKALEDHPSGNRIVYLPAGTYLVSETLTWGKGPHEGVFMKRTLLQGQGQSRTILRLKDNCPGFSQPEQPKAVIYTGRKPAQRFRNAVRDLTIDTGKGNPGAVGAQFIANNQGTFREVTIRSGDGSGVTGLDLAYTDEIGPCLIKNVTVEGFDVGIRCAHAVDSITFDQITLRDQKVAGLRNSGQCVSIRGLNSRNGVPAVINDRYPSVMALIDSQLQGVGISAQQTGAIVNEGTLFARNIKTAGYKGPMLAVERNQSAPPSENFVTGPQIKGGTITEAVSPRAIALFGEVAKAGSLNLPVRETPEVPWDDLSDWANVVAFGADLTGKQDATDALQKAIDSGKPTVYLPNGTYRVDGAVLLRGNVRRLIGCEARMTGNGRIRFVAGTAPVVVVERIDRMVSIVHASSRTLVVRHSGLEGYSNEPAGTGPFFVEDVVGGQWRIKNQNVWARQLNIEVPTTKILNDGGTLWILGYKTERGGTLCETINGGRTEIVGGFAYATSGPKTDPMFTVRDARMSATFGEACFNGNPFRVVVSETRSGQTRLLNRGETLGRLNGSQLPLYVSGN
ncbi:MAG: hypothetical protein OHK0029_14120 [Armatimonadaceae bacterium]